MKIHIKTAYTTAAVRLFMYACLCDVDLDHGLFLLQYFYNLLLKLSIMEIPKRLQTPGDKVVAQPVTISTIILDQLKTSSEFIRKCLNFLFL